MEMGNEEEEKSDDDIGSALQIGLKRSFDNNKRV